MVLLCCLLPLSLYAEPEEQATYLIPDIPDQWADAVRYKDENFSVMFGFAGLLDYTVLDQDEQSIEQVGKQEDKFEARSLRLLFAGTLDFIGPWSYLVAAEYKGFARSPGDRFFNFTDVSFTRHFKGGRQLTIGKQKQPHIFEMVGSAANLVQHERLLEPFFVGRSWGVTYSRTFVEKRIGLSLGWYNDWFVDSGDFTGEGQQWAMRLTALPIWHDEGGRFLHVGLSARYQEDEQNNLRYRGRPGSHVTSFYVDSGVLKADYGINVGLEALWQGYKLTILGEYAKAWVNANSVNDPEFDGYYLTASYIFNGALRPYDALARYSRRVVAGTGWGAFEPFVRFGRVDLDDSAVSGGTMNKWYAGLNWWATNRWKLSVGFGDVELDRFGTRGNTDQWLFRLQWIGP